MSGPLPWYAARASGLVGWGLLTAATLWGLALSTKVFGKRPRPNWLLDLHRMLGALALVFTGVHVGAILLDQYVHFGLTQVLVPFTPVPSDVPNVGANTASAFSGPTTTG